MLKTQWKEKGYIDEPIDPSVDIKSEIRRMCKEKNAIILMVKYRI